MDKGRIEKSAMSQAAISSPRKREVESKDTINMRTSAKRITENERLIESVVDSYLNSKDKVTG